MEGKRKKRQTPTLVIANPDLEARRRAAAVLEVMGGLSTPSEAAKVGGMSLPRYYALEKRALEGLVSACAAPKRKGRQRSPAKEMDRLREQVKRLEREASRNLAMARAAQRAAGIGPPPPSKASGKDDGKKRRKRRPSARALLAAQALRCEPAAPRNDAVSEVVETAAPAAVVSA
jgi:hypothetical protein